MEEFNTNKNVTTPQENKKVVAGILGILLGAFGVHKFFLGYTKEGIIQLIIGLVSCGVLGIIGLIEGIIYLTKTDEEFYNTYQANKKGWF
ncbi:TM2 domain-containing protein [Myroides odoratimimus]|uniref:TM2 domain-containing protein n=1 Tax=Myroides odoratimimus TaxID=76832 RepID=UPI000469712E|nr:TM2 domain-containing protein [Myroides odoratimimus]